MVQAFLRPDADDTDGSWTNESGGTSLFASIDEVTASDTDYIQSGTGDNDTCKIRLANPSGTFTADAVHYRYFKKFNNATVVNLKVRLLQGTTEIASWTHSDISNTPTDANQSLSAPQIAAITDPNDLFLEFIKNPASTWDLTDLGSTLKTYCNFNRPASLTMSGSDITDVADLSGNSKGFGDYPGQTEPTTATLNTTRTVADFNNTTDGLLQVASAIGTGATTYTIIILAKMGSTKQRILAAEPANFLVGWWQGSMKTWFDGSGFRAATGTNDDGDWHLVVARADSGTPTMWDNGTSVTCTGTVAGGPGAMSLNIGSGGDSGSLSQVFAVAACDTALSTSDRQKAEGKLLWEAGLQAKLPSGHPYESAPP